MAISSLNDIKKGMCLEYNGDVVQVMDARFVRMQQRKPVMQTKLKSLTSGKMLEYTYQTGDLPKEADLDRTKAIFLYKEGENYFFMNQSTYDQFFFLAEDIGLGAGLLKEGQEVEAILYNNNPIALRLPPKVTLRVTEAADAVKGNTASGNVTKEVRVETGAVVKVPLFIKQGDRVKISTETGEYSERVTE